jgi:hypothetical protein
MRDVCRAPELFAFGRFSEACQMSQLLEVDLGHESLESEEAQEHANTNSLVLYISAQI